MVGIAQNGIEVRNNLFLALVCGVRQRFPADRNHVVGPFGLIIGNGQIEIKLQHFRIGLNAGFAQLDDITVIFFLDSLTQQHHTGSRIGGVDCQHSAQYGQRFLVHPLGKEVLGIQHRYPGIVRLLFQNTVEKADDPRTVPAVLLILHHKLPHYIHLRFRRHFLVEQQCVQLPLIELFLPGGFIIGGKRIHSHCVIRLCIQYLTVYAVCFVFLPVLHIDITQHNLIAGVHRILRNQALYLMERILIVFNLQVKA